MKTTFTRNPAACQVVVGGIPFTIYPKTESVGELKKQNVSSLLMPNPNQLYMSNGLMVVIAIAEYQKWQNVNALTLDVDRDTKSTFSWMLFKNICNMLSSPTAVQVHSDINGGIVSIRKTSYKSPA